MAGRDGGYRGHGMPMCVAGGDGGCRRHRRDQHPGPFNRHPTGEAEGDTCLVSPRAWLSGAVLRGGVRRGGSARGCVARGRVAHFWRGMVLLGGAQGYIRVRVRVRVRNWGRVRIRLG